MRKRVQRTCDECGAMNHILPCRAVYEHHFCNRRCYSKWLSKRFKGRKFTEEHRRNISRARKGSKASVETRRKMSERRKGRPGTRHTEETKRKISEKITKITNSPDWKKKMREKLTGRRLSEEHKKKISDGLRRSDRVRYGPDHQNWKGGVTSEKKKIVNSPEYRDWRLMVFGCDNYTCRLCGQRGCYLSAHHIRRFADFPELRFAVSNGITLCRDCHNKTKNHEEEYIEYFEDLIEKGSPQAATEASECARS